MPSYPSNDSLTLWNFSLSVYAHAGVADACLHLQDEYGVNVNLLLWCSWLEQRGLRLDESRLAQAYEAIQLWDEHYVIPLRQLRRRMKAEFGVENIDIEQLRQQIKTAELLAEKQVQMCLEQEAQHWCASEIIATPADGENVSFYLRQSNLADTAIAQYVALLSTAKLVMQ